MPMTKWHNELKRRVKSARGNRHAQVIDEYRAGAVRCEQRAKEIRNQEDRAWQLCLASAYRMLAEAEGDRQQLKLNEKGAKNGR
jgi:hypothetical protein